MSFLTKMEILESSYKFFVLVFNKEFSMYALFLWKRAFWDHLNTFSWIHMKLKPWGILGKLSSLDSIRRPHFKPIKRFSDLGCKELTGGWIWDNHITLAFAFDWYWKLLERHKDKRITNICMKKIMTRMSGHGCPTAH